jgi:ribosomal protein S3
MKKKPIKELEIHTMGRPVNANAFRLGYSKTWSSVWVARKRLSKIYFQKDFLITTFITSFFTQYTTPLLAVRNEHRYADNDSSGHDNIIANPFIELAIVFSNIRISRTQTLEITCSFLDALVLEWRYEINHGLKNASSSYFEPKPRRRGRAVYFTDFKAENKFKHIFSKGGQLAAGKTRLLNQIFKSDNDLRLYPIASFDMLQSSTFFRGETIRFSLLKTYLVLFPIIVEKAQKQLVFYLYSLSNLLKTLLFLPSFYGTHTLLITITTIMQKFYFFTQKANNLFQKLIDERSLMFTKAAGAIWHSLKAIENPQPIRLSFLGCHLRNISAQFLTNYICLKLGQYIPIQEILRPILRELKGMEHLGGFKFIIAGRLTRQERAAYLVRRHGIISLTTKSQFIEYAADAKIMRFGVVGIKIWLHILKRRPNLYRFDFCFLGSTERLIDDI